MADYPLVYTTKVTVTGDGFLASVTINGRALLTNEEGDENWWMLGVRPAAIAAHGVEPGAAHLAFQNALEAALVDDAFGAKNSYEAFKAEVERFFNERDQVEEARWEEAGEAIRKGRPVEAPFDQLNREAPTVRPVTIAVERLDKPLAAFRVTDNVIANYALGAAA